MVINREPDDNEYYDHGAFKGGSKEGAIFTDMGNNTDFPIKHRDLWA